MPCPSLGTNRNSGELLSPARKLQRADVKHLRPLETGNANLKRIVDERNLLQLQCLLVQAEHESGMGQSGKGIGLR